MSDIVQKTTTFIENLLANDLNENCEYHNLAHTLRVFKSTKELIENSEVTEDDKKVLLLAALLHDTGFIHGKKNHEEKSVEIAETFLSKEGLEKATIDRVKACILATRMDVEPTNALENIIKDADLSHLAKDYFEEASECLRQELKKQGIVDKSKSEWLDDNVRFFTKKHSYYTDYAKNNWEDKKNENLKKMMEEQAKIEMKKEKKRLKSLMKSEDPEKAIQSVFRITLKNHIKLSDIADTKANILLSVNAIIISIALSNLIPKLDNPSNEHLIIPAIIFLLFTVATIIMSVLATRPNVTIGKFTKEDVNKKKVNLLFFGNFHQMSLEEFDWAMNEMLQDKDYMYSSMIKDLYFLGLVLQKKYSLLRKTYTTFMIGIIVSVVAFSISFILNAG